MMGHLGRDHDVGSSSAAAVHGAAHQAPQVFQVVVDEQLADRDIHRARLRFHMSAASPHLPAGNVTPLDVHAASTGQRNARWAVLVNTSVEPGG